MDINELTELFDGDLESLRKALSTDSKLKSSLSPYVLSNLGKVRMDNAEAMLDKCSRFNVDVIADSDPEYPERLNVLSRSFAARYRGSAIISSSTL